MSKTRWQSRRRYHKVEKRRDAAILNHEHDWIDKRKIVGIIFLACGCGATCREAADGRVVDIVEPRVRQISGYPRF